jgi:glycosyltransferase involved in cell wall biosynthesis
LLVDIRKGTVVERAFCLDAARHLGLFRRYPASFALPDRWISWWPGAYLAGLGLIRRYQPDALWSTFPIPTAHKIGRSLHRRSGLPWIADFRDPMVQLDDPVDPILWRAYDRIEQATIASSQLNIFTTEGTCALYRARYAHRPSASFAVVENGYDEEVFASLPEDSRSPKAALGGRVMLLHSGAIYPLERDPTQLFLALKELGSNGVVSPGTLQVRLRATGHDAEIRRMITDSGVAGLVELVPPVSYRDAISEMLLADGLLILQAGQVKTQIPAKVYEYLRAGRPILALTDSDGDTARVLAAAGVRHIARINSVQEIARVMEDFLDHIRAGTAPKPDVEVVRRASRRNRTRELAGLLDRVIGEQALLR